MATGNLITGHTGFLRVMAIAGAFTALGAASVWPVGHLAHELFAAHMVQHLLAMNVAALLIAVSLFDRWRLTLSLPAVTAVQMASLWLWHMPAVFAAAHHSLLLQGFMQVSLFGAALLFWWAVFSCARHTSWPSILALLVTAKVFCLLGAIFIFSRRPLYPGFGVPEAWNLTALEDQQLAGLIMVSSCVLVYVAAAVALFGRWLLAMEARRHDRPVWADGSDDAASAG